MVKLRLFLRLFLLALVLFHTVPSASFDNRFFVAHGAVGDPCYGKNIGQACRGTAALNLGEFQNGKYMIMPSGCSNTTTNPTCTGNDATAKTWNSGSSSWYDIPSIFNVDSNYHASPDTERGHVTTPIIAAITLAGQGGAHAAARHCDQMTYGGFTDWYLPSKSELAYIYCKSTPGSHNSSNPTENPNCGGSGPSNQLTGFNSYTWSSSERDSDEAYHLDFSDGTSYYYGKDTSFRVRCIRRYQDVTPTGIPETTTEMLTALGLTTNLLVNLDAGDSASYSGSGQTWTDRSGNGNNFFLGTTASVEGSTDPTFSGTAGGKSPAEFFNVGGGYLFTQATSGWDDGFHKNNAAFTIAMVVNHRGDSLGYANYFCNSGGSNGVCFSSSSGGNLTVAVMDGDANAAITDGAIEGSWHFVAISINEATGAGGGVLYSDGRTNTFNSTYSSPSASNPSYAARLFSNGQGNGYWPHDGSKVMATMIWNRALSLSELQSLRDRFKRNRLPVLP